MGGVTSASAVAPVAAIRPPTTADTVPRDYAGIRNVVAYHDGYYSGSMPDGAEAFETLHAMGIKTIISVDGAAPDVEAAKRLGMRYIHLPISYNAFDKQRRLKLTRATRDAMRRLIERREQTRARVRILLDDSSERASPWPEGASTQR